MDGASFCHNCGTDLRHFIDQQAPLSSSPSFGAVREDVKKYSDYGKSTDRIVSPLWILVPISSLAIAFYLIAMFILALESFLASFGPPGSATPPTITPAILPLPFNLAFLGILEAASLVPSILFLYLLYILIKRRNLHFERQNRLFYSISYALRVAAGTRTGKLVYDVGPELQSIDYDLQTSRNRETEKSAVLWVILLIVPIVEIFAYFYIFYFLTNDFQEHEANENLVLSKMSRVLGSMGVPFSFSRDEGGIHYSSFWIYFLLTIVTLGIFAIYWEYLLISGPNKHFRNQVKIEDNLVEALSTLAPP